MLQTLGDYAEEILPPAFMKEFKDICNKHDKGKLSEINYCAAVNELIINRTRWSTIVKLSNSIKTDFRLNVSFTHHFISRLMARFHNFVIDGLMNQIRLLADRCCKNNLERSRARGITLVMDPTKLQLITIF